MTFLPVEQVRIGKGLKGPVIDAAGPQCQNPDCDYLATDEHHAIRRSHLAGAYEWVYIDGVARPNILHLCWLCHQEVTTNKVRIFWDEGEWCWGAPGVRLDPLLDAGLLVSPPSGPVLGPALPGEPSVEQNPGPPAGTGTDVVAGAADASHVPGPGETCPTCQRRVNHKRKADSPETATVKVSDTYAFRLPADEKQGLKELVTETAVTIGTTGLKYPASKTIEVGMLLIHRHADEAQEIVREMAA